MIIRSQHKKGGTLAVPAFVFLNPKVVSWNSWIFNHKKKPHLSAEKRGLRNSAMFLPPPWDVG
jgi:hypothetical protein